MVAPALVLTDRRSMPKDFPKGLCPVCEKVDATLQKTLGDAAKPSLVCVAGSWLLTELSRVGVGLGSGTAFRCCKECINLFENHVRGKVGTDHSLLCKKYDRTLQANVHLLGSKLMHEGKTLVSASRAACVACCIVWVHVLFLCVVHFSSLPPPPCHHHLP